MEHVIPHGKHLLVHAGDLVKAGDALVRGPLVLAFEHRQVPEEKRHREDVRKKAPQVGEVEGQHETEEAEHRVRADGLEPARHRQRRCNHYQGQEALDGKERAPGFREQRPQSERQEIWCEEVVTIEQLILDRALSQLPPEPTTRSS